MSFFPRKLLILSDKHLVHLYQMWSQHILRGNVEACRKDQTHGQLLETPFAKNLHAFA